MSSTASASAPSSSPSSSTFHFPSVLPKKEQPNAHPYAIQTSSTAILSRSNSTSAHASVGPHHYIPMSPSPTSPQHSPTKRHRPARHRYSRSLTSDQPPSLPPPPAATSNQTNDAEDNTPTKHTHRETSAGPLPQNLDLPDDPKSWTPSQLSMYLSATLRTGDANLPAPVAKDIAKFVTEQRITGKAFLRLSEDGLLQFGINQLWRSTLLAASRGLRQTTLHGRIWGFGYTPPNEEEEDSGNVSSSSSVDSDTNTRVRSRHSSLATDKNGKVKHLIYSLEKLSPTRPRPDDYPYDVSYDSDNGGSPAKSENRMFASSESFSSNHHKDLPPTPSPSKNNRLPARGSVNDLFNPPAVEFDDTFQVKDDDMTIKVSKHNVNGREPRMLPLPPIQAPMLTPLHTGSRLPLPLSPEHTGVTYDSLHAADYELGFRTRPCSPHSQKFIVRHNPASPSNSLHDESSGKRSLPFPPFTGETHLYHPKPRRLVGNIDDPGVTDPNGKETNRATDSNTSGTEGYETAFETESKRSESVEFNLTVDGGFEEPTVQELVASESKSISGVEAWELDLGETVKRIGRDMDNDYKRGSVSEIGRKAGKHSTGPRGARVDNGSKRGQMLDLFEHPKEDTKADNSSEAEERKIDELEGEFRLMEQRLSDKEKTLLERERTVLRHERAISQREQVVQRRELEVSLREGAVGIQERALTDRQVLEADQWSTKQKEVQERVNSVEDRQRLLEANQKTLENQESSIVAREESIRRREVELEVWEKRVEAKEEELINVAVSWPAPINILRKCWKMFGVDTATSDSSGPHRTDSRAIQRDILFGPTRSGGYLVLMSIGVCVVALRVLGKIRRR